MSCIDKFTTLGLIQELLAEAQKNSIILTKIFPERLNRYSDVMLSMIWRGPTKRNAYIEGIRSKIKEGGYSFPNASLSLLTENLKKILGNNSYESVELIKRYILQKINSTQLIDGLKKRISKVSGQIPVTDEELSLMLVGSKIFIRNVRSRIRDVNSPHYNPNYKFSIKVLNDFKRTFQVLLGNNAKGYLKHIDDYIRLNPDIKLYSKQQYTITNPNFFKNMETPDQFYWLGFLWADGSLESKAHAIKLELSTKDKIEVVKFAKAVGFEKDRIKDYTHHYRDKEGNLKTNEMSRLKFSCKPMADQLRSLGLLDFKLSKRGLPQIVLQELTIAKHEISITSSPKAWYYTKSGINALCFLLGFYDGDGNYRGGLSAQIINTNKMLLDEIKVLYKIDNRVCLGSIQSEYPNSYRLALSPQLFSAMINFYRNSMIRKRPQ